MHIFYTCLKLIKYSLERKMRVLSVKYVFDNSKFSREFPIYRYRLSDIFRYIGEGLIGYNVNRLIEDIIIGVANKEISPFIIVTTIGVIIVGLRGVFLVELIIVIIVIVIIEIEIVYLITMVDI